jgi:hypothetical protein
MLSKAHAPDRGYVVGTYSRRREYLDPKQTVMFEAVKSLKNSSWCMSGTIGRGIWRYPEADKGF